ncbi:MULTISPECIES: fumarate hydratase C-terminal domain-containing protein [Pelosinus]|uniref:Fe-S type hydro-lyase tartrate/fumarate beta region n=1 Tax=Pelosinus fermentans B4 TaxID=1149862 RepID=I8RKP2_9FIRM|nr:MULTISPECIES: fumarate hydratase C-terminal domain-containing protein [Pelosinus]EIW19010.1 Fe-S type hydro-lyase tartrate/fumarate beta region [Pelosinus fermentans B4]EIW21780.1 Fe-S type hydro-lyase tartrate/fumarate beta region [Pelosinus fermentans A11]OAM95371.1 Fe-S type hydro-lyase tartrate/fumarate beta region [Pelosinus fermentans DSM 17108]SDR27143.1 fumarate hydratase subunit beta [Pelosinus fermentans]
MELRTPLTQEVINKLKINDQITITGKIYAGRDAALPKLMKLYKKQELEKNGIYLEGGVIFHTAVSDAGIGPTSSNKLEIEESIPLLSKAGIKIHLGKGKLTDETVRALKEEGAIFAVTPPVSALLTAKMRHKKVAAFPEEGIEALYELIIEDFPAIVAIAHGESIFDRK